MDRQSIICELQQRYLHEGPALNERQRRHWAAKEALTLGRGGLTIVSEALRMSPNTIKRGMRELSSGQPDAQSDATTRIRKSGGGRKPQRHIARG